MSRATYFVQECPTCGRGLQIRVTYLGKIVACQHCHAQFQALDPEQKRPTSGGSSLLLDRANELLASSDAWLHRQR